MLDPLGKCAYMFLTFSPAHHGFWSAFWESQKSIGDLVGHAYRAVETF
jgi:hypothetical protein